MNCGQSFAQDVQSNFVRFRISNLPGVGAPDLKIVSPLLTDDLTHKTGVDELVLVGEVKAEKGVKFVTVNDELRPVNEAGLFTTRLNLTPGENSVRIMAADSSDHLADKTIVIIYEPPVSTLAEEIRATSVFYGLIIGIDEYQDPYLKDLEHPVQDAEMVFETLVENYLFDAEHTSLLRNAKRKDIVDALDYLAKTVTENDNLLIFYAGHGNWDERADIGYWLPSDAELSSSANWFRNSTLVDHLKMINSKHTLLITDACFAGSIFKITRSGFSPMGKAYEELYKLNSRKAMTSGTLTEVPDRSSFTKYLLERLNENSKMYLSSWELYSSFRLAVINNSDAVPQYGEIQYVGDEGGDFIFIKKK